jgi:HTH-type transcriptional regulator/antitoxin HigA
MNAQQDEMVALGQVASAISATATKFAGTAVELFHYTYTPIQSEKELLERANVMDYLMDLAQHENDIVLVFANAISDRIEEFEDQMEMPTVPVAEKLKMLMEAHSVKQKDLKNIAPQSVISELLNGKRTVNLNQAKGFARYFNLPVSYFVE